MFPYFWSSISDRSHQRHLGDMARGSPPPYYSLPFKGFYSLAVVVHCMHLRMGCSKERLFGCVSKGERRTAARGYLDGEKPYILKNGYDRCLSSTRNVVRTADTHALKKLLAVQLLWKSSSRPALGKGGTGRGGRKGLFRTCLWAHMASMGGRGKREGY